MYSGIAILLKNTLSKSVMHNLSIFRSYKIQLTVCTYLPTSINTIQLWECNRLQIAECDSGDVKSNVNKVNKMYTNEQQKFSFNNRMAVYY